MIHCTKKKTMQLEKQEEKNLNGAMGLDPSEQVVSRRRNADQSRHRKVRVVGCCQPERVSDDAIDDDCDDDVEMG